MKKKAVVKINYTQLREPDTGFQLNLYTHGGHYHHTPKGMPSVVRLFGQHYKVYYHTRIYAEKKKKQRLRGIVVFAHRIIFIDPSQSIHDMKETLYHEIGHVYVKAAQTQSVALSKLTYQQIEEICDMFGEAFPDFATNNSI